MNRRTYLATLGTASAAALSGCLGSDPESHPAFDIDRQATASDDDCAEQELLDFERINLAPRLAGPTGLPTAVEWSVPLRAGEELYLRITNPDMAFLPHLSVVDPEGTAVIDERPVENIYRMQPEQDGTYTVTVRNPRWTEGGDWMLDLVWYDQPGCR
jgi:hypothetical protein